MSRPQRRGPNQARRPQVKRPGAVDIWRIPGPLPEIEPIAVPSAPGAVLRSLGDPPMWSVDLLAQPPTTDDVRARPRSVPHGSGRQIFR